jgi:transcriptional regulator with XRE-family HTH domain
LASFGFVKKKPKKRVRVYDEEGLKLLGEKLRELRKQKNMTQEELAYESGVIFSQIARIETFQANPTVSTIFKLCRTLGISPRALFDFTLTK